MKSQPEWDAMVKDVEPRLDPRDAIAEVESQFMDEFKKLMEERGHTDIPEITSFPTWVVVTQHGIKEQKGREYDDYIKALQQIKAILPAKSKSPMSLKSKSKSKSKTRSKTPKSRSKTTKSRSKTPKSPSSSDPRLQLIS
jgi:hypothetical protein